jgi:glycerophosphoryl diester phosphodiesterase
MAALGSLLEHVRKRPRATPLLWPPLNIAHRGAAGEAPENTLAAFELAWQQGADGIEFDVHLTADGIPVVIHDPRVDRTTSGRGWVRECRASALRCLDAGTWFNRRFPSRARPRYAGAKIPRLSEVLAWVRARKCLAFVEIKDATPGIEAKVLTEIQRASVGSQATIISFDLDTLRRLRQLDSRASLGLDVSRRLLALRRAKSLGAVALLPHWTIASPAFVRRAHEESVRVIPWTLDQPRWIRRRILDGVDGIITNYPARLAEIRAGFARP